MPPTTRSRRHGAPTRSTAVRRHAMSSLGLRELGERWRDNGFVGLGMRQRAVVAVGASAVLLLVGVLLIGVVRSIGGPVGEAAVPESAASGAGAQSSGNSGAVAAAALATSRLISSDPRQRETGYGESVVEESRSAVRAAFESGVTAILSDLADGSASDPEALSATPLGWSLVEGDDGLVDVDIWTRLDLVSAAAPVPQRLYHQALFHMRWDGTAWRVESFGGTTPGPDPDTPAAAGFTPMGAVPADGS